VVLPPDVNGWIRGPANVFVSATDAETGVKEIRTTVGAAAPVVTPGTTATVPVTAEGVTTVGYTAVDLAGNEASGTATVRIDTAGPTIAITSPPASITGATGVTAGYTCADPTSGVASCQGVLTGPGVNTPVDNGAALPALAAGSYTLTVTAVDVAGNTSTATRPFSVGYGVCLKYNPTSSVHLLATAVLKFQLCDAAGNNLSSASLAVVATKIDGTIQPAKNIWGLFNLGYGFYFDASSKTYIYALPTPGIGAGSHSLGFSVAGSTSPTYVLPFKLDR
jgi:hypothetical protein